MRATTVCTFLCVLFCAFISVCSVSYAATPEVTSIVSTPEITPIIISTTVEAVIKTTSTEVSIPTSAAGTAEIKPLIQFAPSIPVPVVSAVKVKYPVATRSDLENYIKSHKHLPSATIMGLYAGKAKLGMDSEAIQLIYGEPTRKIEKQGKKSVLEVWVISSASSDTCILIGVKDNKVVSIDNYGKTSDAERLMQTLDQ